MSGGDEGSCSASAGSSSSDGSAEALSLSSLLSLSSSVLAAAADARAAEECLSLSLSLSLIGPVVVISNVCWNGGKPKHHLHLNATLFNATLSICLHRADVFICYLASLHCAGKLQVIKYKQASAAGFARLQLSAAVEVEVVFESICWCLSFESCLFLPFSAFSCLSCFSCFSEWVWKNMNMTKHRIQIGGAQLFNLFFLKHVNHQLQNVKSRSIVSIKQTLLKAQKSRKGIKKHEKAQKSMNMARPSTNPVCVENCILIRLFRVAYWALGKKRKQHLNHCKHQRFNTKEVVVLSARFLVFIF